MQCNFSSAQIYSLHKITRLFTYQNHFLVWFQWLMNFLDNLKSWKENCDQCPENFDKNASNKMFLSLQTYEGFKITVHSVIEETKFLLQECMEFVLFERFCQDSFRDYFGNQRKIGRKNNNPDVNEFGYNNNAIRIQRQVSCQSGNTRGRKDRSKAWQQITDEPVLCKKKA